MSTKNKGGRPSKFDSVDMDQVKILCEKGFTDAEMANFYGITERTWYNWKKEHEEFFQALKDWKHPADEKVVRSLYERATGYSAPEDKIFNDNGVALVVPTMKHYPPDTTAAIFWLKNRKPAEWRDKQEIHNHQSGDVEELDLTKLSKKQLEELGKVFNEPENKTES